MSSLARAALAACVLALSAGAVAQTTPTPPAAPAAAGNIKRTLLQTVEVPGTNFNTITGIAEVAPNVAIGRHTHPGPETGYMIEGDMTLLIDGQPPKIVKTGESYQVPAGAVHDAKAGEKGAKVMAVYVVEKGRPLASPAP